MHFCDYASSIIVVTFEPFIDVLVFVFLAHQNTHKESWNMREILNQQNKILYYLYCLLVTLKFNITTYTRIAVCKSKKKE